jgi:RHS repeat-associated protein
MPEELTDADGNIVWRARYATWGKLVFENVTGIAPDGFEQNLRMQGQYHDRETGLYYNTFRYYDCDTGRFTTEDPIGLLGGINLYQYAPNPLGWIDPWGWAKKKNSNCVDYTNKPKAKVNNAKLGDVVRTPTSHSGDFSRRGDGTYMNTKTGEVWTKSDTQHSGSPEWKVGIGKESPTPTRKITVAQDFGEIIKIDKK